jgi:5'-3' exonuclease
LPYKGNRDPLANPKYYAEIKTYLLDYWSAKLISGREADDAMGCEQYKHPDKSTVICSIDKDMKQIPGWHYNWMKDDLSFVKMLDANLFFYRQMLEGDRVDNIPGIKGVGPKTVDKLMKDCAFDLGKVKAKVEEYYEREYGASGGVAYDEVATLLFIQREEGKTYRDYGL